MRARSEGLRGLKILVWGVSRLVELRNISEIRCVREVSLKSIKWVGCKLLRQKLGPSLEDQMTVLIGIKPIDWLLLLIFISRFQILSQIGDYLIGNAA